MFKFTFEFSEIDLFFLFLAVVSTIIFVFMGSTLLLSVVSGIFLFCYFKLLHGIFLLLKKVVVSFVGKPIDRDLPDQNHKKKI